MANSCQILKRSYPSNLKNIELFCNETQMLLKKIGLERQNFAVELLVREAMTNAIVHGNKNEDSRKISCRLRVCENWITIRVLDEGDGFAWRNTCQKIPKPTVPSGRGLRIYSLYAARCGFNSSGNGVVLLRRI